MPTDVAAPQDVTDRQKLMTARLGRRGPLSRFIALRRVPGPDWTPIETIAHELYKRTGEPITRMGLTKWMAHYGIPSDTTRDGTTQDAEAYLKTVKVLVGEVTSI